MILLALPPFKEGSRSGRWPSTSKVKNFYFLYPPWFLAYSAALLEKDRVEVDLVDAVAQDMDNDQFVEYVIKKSPELLIAETSTITIDRDMQLMKRIKEEVGCKIALAGPHVTALCPETMAKYAFIDFVLIGEYELTVLELVRKLGIERYGTIKGLAYRDGNKIVVNERRPLIPDLDALPFPARHFLPMEKYNEAFAEVPNQQMITSRGCPFGCIFCVWPQVLFERKVRLRSAKSIVDEMQMLIEKYKPKEIYFDDDSFTLNRKHVVEVCEEIKKRGLETPWSCMGDARLPLEVLKTMKDAGCVGIKFGVESASPKVLKEIKKSLNIDDVVKFNKVAKDLGFKTHATYTLGHPADTKKTIDHTLRFAVTLGTDSFQISIATPLPGTEFYNWAKQNKYLVTEDFSKYDGNSGAVVSYPWLSKKEIDDAFKKSIALTTKFDFGLVKYFARYAYDKGGARGLLAFVGKEGPGYAKRMINKKIFKMKSKFGAKNEEKMDDISSDAGAQ
jgi:radical SAM superfamily enzyme YgiQ (UPF0313 family)